MSRSNYTPGSVGGVTSLMYVGDTPTADMPSDHEVGIGLAGLVAAIWGRGILRLAGAGAAAYVGRRVYLAKKP